MIKQATRPKPTPPPVAHLLQQTIAIDRQTIDKLSRLVSIAQADNNALRADLAAMRERLAVVEAKCAIQSEILAGQDEAIRAFGMRWGVTYLTDSPEA